MRGWVVLVAFAYGLVGGPTTGSVGFLPYARPTPELVRNADSQIAPLTYRILTSPWNDVHLQVREAPGCWKEHRIGVGRIGLGF